MEQTCICSYDRKVDNNRKGENGEITVPGEADIDTIHEMCKAWFQ